MTMSPPRRLQQVFIIATDKLVVMWFVQDEIVHGFLYLFQRIIATFPEYFRAKKMQMLFELRDGGLKGICTATK